MDDAEKRMHIAAKKYWEDKAKRDKARNPETTSNKDFKKWNDNRGKSKGKMEFHESRKSLSEILQLGSRKK